MPSTNKPPWDDRAVAPFTTSYGSFQLTTYRFLDGSEHAAIVSQCPTPDGVAPLLRLQSSCLTGLAFRSLLCDCRQQLSAALKRIAAEGGCVIHLDQEGRAHGLVEKTRHLALIAEGMNTYQAAAANGVDADLRDYGHAVAIATDLLGATGVRLLTNNPCKIACVKTLGLNVVERVAIETVPTESNRSYLEAKKAEGHLLTL